MSAITAPSPGGTERKDKSDKQPMSKGKKIGLALVALWILGIVFFVIVFGLKPHKAHDVTTGAFTPTNEFKLDTWFALGPVDFNKGVLYVLLAGGITLAVMLWIAHRLKQRPGRLQTAIEMFYGLTSGMAK